MSNTSAETPEEGKHTPGPWHVENGVISCWVASETKLVCDITGDWSEQQVKANAELIARAPSLERENAELKARLTTVQDLLDASLIDYETHTETIKRYKEALEAMQRITKDDRPILAQIISSALSGTNE